MDARTVRSGYRLAVLPQLWGALSPGERRAVRILSREARMAADTLCDHLHLDDFEMAGDSDGLRFERPPDEREVVSSVTRFLQRGGRPRRLLLRLRVQDRKPEEMTRIGMAMLAAFAGLKQQISGEPCLSQLHLQGVPLTPDLARAVASAAPSLQRLTLNLHDWSTPRGAGGDTALVGITELLRLVGPHLQRLSLEAWPVWAMPVLDTALQHCSRLTTFSLEHPIGVSLPGVLESLAQLPHLCDLELRGGCRSYASWSSHSSGYQRSAHPDWPSTATTATAEALGRLTRLTRLATLGHGASDFLPALPHMPGLGELNVADAQLPLDSLAQLSGLSSLTRLVVQGVTEARPGVDRGGSGAAPSVSHVDLPPGLQEFMIGSSVQPALLLALRLPPSLARLHPRGLFLYTEEEEDEDEDEDGDALGWNRYRDARAADRCKLAVRLASTACGMLAGRFDGHACVQPFEVCLGTGPEWYAVPGGFTELIAAMRPLRLRRLHIVGSWVQDCDVEAIARELTGLEELKLEVVEAHEALPLLGRLERLKYLELQFDDTPWVETLLEVCNSAPSLRQLLLSFQHRIIEGEGEDPDYARSATDAMDVVIRSLRAALRRQGRRGLAVGWSSDYGDGLGSDDVGTEGGGS